MKKYFFLFSSCVPVKGFSRSIVCNLQVENFEFIPNILFEILTKYRTKSIQQIVEIYGKENENHIVGYFETLENKELGFFSDNIDNFKPVKYDYFDPYIITNAIIDYDNFSEYDISKVILQLNDLFCQHLELRLYSYFDFSTINQFLAETIDSPIRGISLIVKYGLDNSTPQKIKLFLKNNKRIKRIIVHSHPNEKKIYHVAGVDTYITYTNEVLESEQCCGNVSSGYFSPNIQFLTEAKVANSCLSKKISVDKYGKIKNCPSMSFDYGSVDVENIRDCIDKDNFKDMWNVTKDQISICKDCEFRYICHDCRAYRENENDLFSKPLKCNYNPYEAVWE